MRPEWVGFAFRSGVLCKRYSIFPCLKNLSDWLHQLRNLVCELSTRQVWIVLWKLVIFWRRFSFNLVYSKTKLAYLLSVELVTLPHWRGSYWTKSQTENLDHNNTDRRLWWLLHVIIRITHVLVMVVPVIILHLFVRKRTSGHLVLAAGLRPQHVGVVYSRCHERVSGKHEMYGSGFDQFQQRYWYNTTSRRARDQWYTFNVQCIGTIRLSQATIHAEK